MARTGNQTDPNRAGKSLTGRENVGFVAVFLKKRKKKKTNNPTYFSVGLAGQIRGASDSSRLISLPCSLQSQCAEGAYT